MLHDQSGDLFNDRIVSVFEIRVARDRQRRQAEYMALRCNVRALGFGHRDLRPSPCIRGEGSGAFRCFAFDVFFQDLGSFVFALFVALENL